MKNTLLNFVQTEVPGVDASDTYYIQDYTNLYFKIDPKYYTDAKYFEYYQVADDELVDYISYKKYDTVQRWDLILIMNNINSPIELPKSYNTVLSKGEMMFNRWNDIYGLNKPEWYLDLKRKYFISLASTENEKYRVIKLVRKPYMTQFMYELDDIYKTYVNSVA